MAFRLTFLAAALTVGTVSGAPHTHLFVDDHDVLYRSGTKRVAHYPVRSADNPVIKADQPWEFTVSYNSALRDAVTGRYKMWYQAEIGGAKETTGVCYAESDDGVHWTKPALGIFSYHGQDTNFVLPPVEGHYGASVLLDAKTQDASRRYKMAYWDCAYPGGKRLMGLNVAFSPDGIHWKPYSDKPIMKGSYGKHAELPLVGDTSFEGGSYLSVSDAIDAIYDPGRDKFVIYSKTWIDTPEGQAIWKRAIVRTESTDFIHWSKPQLVMVPDEFDGRGVEYFPTAKPIDRSRRGVQFHAAPTFHHAGIYFSLVETMDEETGGGMPIELAVSHDGIEWSRPFRQRPFIELNPDRNAFDAGVIWASETPIVLPDEIRFYYGGYRWRWLDGPVQGLSGIGMASLPRDRFAGLIPIANIAQVTLKPLELSAGQRMTLNADASDGGTIRCELIRPDGRRVPGFTWRDANQIQGDGFRHPVTWRSPTALPAGTYLLRIHLDNAEVFGVTLD